MLGKFSTLITVCLSVGLFSLTSAQEKANSYSLVNLMTPLTSDELRAALDYLGLKLERFSYEIPYKHHIDFSVQQFVNGKRRDALGSGGTLALEAGQHTLILLVYQMENKVEFAIQSEGIRYSIGTVSRKGYNAITMGKLTPAQLAMGQKVPFFVVAANHQSITSFGPNETLDNIVPKYELVIAVLAELARE